jgi:amidase
MSTPDELSRLDATAQAALVQRGELKPTELVEAAVRRAERVDPELGSIIPPAFERALAQAANAGIADLPFAGVPFALKDLGGAEAGMPHHAGMRFLKDAGWVESEDAFLTDRFRDAGLVSIGRTNTPELALLPTTEPEAYGPTRNPWNPAHSAGGSSGGAAAAVAAGIVPVAHASDGGGSIRGPASMCGLVGLKPTRGRCSFGPSLGERWSGFSCEFVVSRSVRDSARLLDLVAGPMPGDPYSAAPPPVPFASALDSPLPALRIGILSAGVRDVPLDPACSVAVTEAARALEARGHHVESSHPEPLNGTVHVGAYVGIVSANVARALASWGAKVGRPVEATDVEPLTWALAERGRSLTAPEHLANLEVVHRFGRDLAAWWESGFDLLVTPTQAEPPPELGFISSTAEEPVRAFIRAAPYGMFTLPFNLSGQPGLSVPGISHESGLPIGVQLVARAGREDLLLAVAAQLEQDQPWADRRPALHA